MGLIVLVIVVLVFVKGLKAGRRCWNCGRRYKCQIYKSKSLERLFCNNYKEVK